MLLCDTPRAAIHPFVRRCVAAVASNSAKRTEWHRVRTDANTAESISGEGGRVRGSKGGREEETQRRAKSGGVQRGKARGFGRRLRRGETRGESVRADSVTSDGRRLASLVAPRLDGGGGREMHGPRLGGTREAGRACERRWSAQFGSRHCESPSCLAHRDRIL